MATISAPFLLSSVYTGGKDASFALTLTNRSGKPVRNFTLGYSGPGRIKEGSATIGGTIIQQVSNWVEIAPPKDFELADGASWTVTVQSLFFPLVHWTDGAAAGMVALSDGTIHATQTAPTRRAGFDGANKRGVVRFDVPVPAPSPLSILPWPNSVSVSGHRTAPEGFALSAEGDAAKAALASFSDLVDNLFAGENWVRPAEEGGFAVSLVPAADLPNEAYRLSFAGDAATIAASHRTGFLYGLISLTQAARGARLFLESYSFPTAGTIEDAPYLSWRGCHWDTARRFYSTKEIAQFLRIMAWNKLNVFHWHLSDDEAFRIEIKAYPELTAKGAWRGYGLEVPPLLGSGPEPHGGYYSQESVREIVALGESLGIDIVPEVDVPGHCYALLQALPQLKDAGENGLYISVQGFANNSLNPAVEAVYDAVETIFSEMCALFPSRYFHVGADEVPEDAWTSSPKAKAMLAGIGGGDAHTLQAQFLRRIQAFLTQKGKITGAWEEAAHGGGIDKDNCYLVGWRAVESNPKLAREGYNVVVSPGQAYYLDMAHSDDWAEPGAHWAGNSNIEQTYRFVPDGGWTEAEREKLMGIQTCIWSEPMTDRGVFERLVFPRLSAMAETAWTQPEAKSWERFAPASTLMPSLYGIIT